MGNKLERFYHGFERARRSCCNICGMRRVLSWDHVPPKQCRNRTAVKLQTAFQKLVSGKEEYQYTISQNGLKYRTLCRQCNNDLLGHNLDPYLVNFAAHVASAIESPLALPRYHSIPISIPRLIRAVFGHMLAAKVTREQTVPDEAMRSCIFDLDGPIADNLNLYYWVYPYGQVTTVIRDVCMPTRRGDLSEFSMFSMLKFFPVAFLLSDKDSYEGLPRLTVSSSLGPNEATMVNLDLSDVRRRDWPEEVDPGNSIIGGQSWESAVTAQPRTK